MTNVKFLTKPFRYVRVPKKWWGNLHIKLEFCDNTKKGLVSKRRKFLEEIAKLAEKYDIDKSTFECLNDYV